MNIVHLKFCYFRQASYSRVARTKTGNLKIAVLFLKLNTTRKLYFQVVSQQNAGSSCLCQRISSYISIKIHNNCCFQFNTKLYIFNISCRSSNTIRPKTWRVGVAESFNGLYKRFYKRCMQNVQLPKS